MERGTATWIEGHPVPQVHLTLMVPVNLLYLVDNAKVMLNLSTNLLNKNAKATLEKKKNSFIPQDDTRIFHTNPEILMFFTPADVFSQGV